MYGLINPTGSHVTVLQDVESILHVVLRTHKGCDVELVHNLGTRLGAGKTELSSAPLFGTILARVLGVGFCCPDDNQKNKVSPQRTNRSGGT